MENVTKTRFNNVGATISHSDALSGISGNSSTSSSTSSSQTNLDVPQDRRSNVTILTDSSSENWTLRKGANKANAIDTVVNWKSVNGSVDAVQKVPNLVVVEENIVCNSNVVATENYNTMGEELANNLPYRKEVVRMRNGTKFYGSGGNTQQVLSSLNLSLREGDM